MNTIFKDLATLGLKDVVIQKCLHYQGKFIGNHPLKWGGVTFVLCAIAALIGWIPRLAGKPFLY
jgi:Na+-transporting NADH:ubiquinone oxidoreductase subunit NqrB